MPHDFVLLHSRHTVDCRAHVNKHFLGYNSLQLVTNGSVELFYDDIRHLLTPPTFWAAYPGARIRFHAAPEFVFWEHRYAAFCGGVVLDWMASGLWPIAPQAAPSPSCVAIFDELLAYAVRNDALSRVAAKNRLESLLIVLAEARKESDTHSEPWLKRIQNLDPEKEFAPDYDCLARESGVSLSTLRRRFRAATGCGLHEYFLRCRITRACALLEKDISVKAVADRLGYADVFFFSRQFRQVIGVPPAAYRRSRIM